MSKRILLILSHSIEEHDQLKLLSGLGYDVFSLGGYINPHEPHDPKRPALPGVKHWPELQAAVDAQGTDDNIGNAAKKIPAEILDWLGPEGIIICHHYLSRIYEQWEHLRVWRNSGGRVIWRTVGQSVESNEREAKPYRDDGLEIVRYSPRERNIPGYAGEDAVIRFYKDPSEWCGWTGDEAYVTNVTQNLLQRHPWTNAEFYLQATQDLPCVPVGPGSEALPGGIGEQPLELMQQTLRDARAYIYCGTQPASYTLGLLEALMTGTPVVSIGPSHMQIFPYGHELFEGADLSQASFGSPAEARRMLRLLLDDHEVAKGWSEIQRAEAVNEFGLSAVGEAWRTYLE